MKICKLKPSREKEICVDDLNKNYPKLSPRYKIILILENMGKKMEEIMQIMSFGENAYYSAKSRINGAKK